MFEVNASAIRFCTIASAPSEAISTTSGDALRLRQPLVERDLDQRAAERAGEHADRQRAGRNGMPFCAANHAA